MASHQRDWYRDGGQPSFGEIDLTPAVKWLMIVLFGSFVASLALGGLLPRIGPGYDLAAWLGFTPRLALEGLRVWQLGTYILLPNGILQFVFDILMLYMFGKEVERLYGTRRFLLLFFGAAAFGALFYALVHFDGGALIGAGAAISAIILVFTLHYPRMKILLFFILPIEMWLATTLIIIAQLAMYAGGGWPVLAILGGALFGFLFYRYQGAIKGWFEGMEERAEARDRAKHAAVEARLDQLLDKINKVGMAGLTDGERRFLKRASERRREGSRR